MNRKLSVSAHKEAGRAARKIAKEADSHGWDVTDSEGHASEILLERSYEEADRRNVYQSEDEYERWLDWRTEVERLVMSAK